MLKKTFQNIFNSKVDAIGLSIFRICFSVVLFFEISQLNEFKNIIYDKEPFQYIGEIDVTFIFKFWFISIGLLFLGLFTRIATITNYIFSVIIFSSASHFEYHMFYAYVGINFLFMFMPISRVFSLDSLLQKVKYTNIGRPFQVDRKILKINYIVPVFVGIALVYFDSVFHKLSSKMWTDGLGVWLPSSLPMVTWNDTSFLLNNEFLIKFLGYFVLIFETVFIFLFWFKKFRLPFAIIGIFFHLGIVIAYPIPWFGLGVSAIYLLLVPIHYWKKIANSIKLKNPIYKFYYDVECPLCNKVIVIIKHFDIFNAVQCVTVQGNYQNDDAIKNIDEETLLINIHGVTNSGKVSVGFWAYVQLFKSLIYTYPLGLLISIPGISHIGQSVYKFVAGNRLTERCTAENCAMPVFTNPVSETDDLLIKGFNKLSITQFFWKFVFFVLVFGQILVTWFSPTIQNHFPKVSYFDKVLKTPYYYTKDFYKDYLGITKHDVFVDSHFLKFNHEVKITYINEKGKECNFPIINEKGMPFGYTSGAIWRNLSFNVVTTNLNQNKIEKGIEPYLKYFYSKKGITNFQFYIKDIKSPNGWEKDFLHKQMANSWKKVGSGNLKNNLVTFEWNDNMKRILLEEKNQ